MWFRATDRLIKHLPTRGGERDNDRAPRPRGAGEDAVGLPRGSPTDPQLHLVERWHPGAVVVAFEVLEQQRRLAQGDLGDLIED
jgi:hypothetical protein